MTRATWAGRRGSVIVSWPAGAGQSARAVGREGCPSADRAGDRRSADLFRPDLIAARAELTRSGWMLELFLPAEALNGFDDETNRRLGFAYQIADHVRDDQFFTVGREFPVGENPSLWSTLELLRLRHALVAVPAS